MGEKRAFKERKNSKELIIQAAMRVFCHYGYLGSTYDKIAEEAGVSKSLIIKHFNTKEDLLVICLERILSGFVERVTSQTEQGLNYREHTLATHEAFKANRNEWQLIIGTLATPALEPIVQQLFEKHFQTVYKMLGHYAGELKAEKIPNITFTITALHLTYILSGMGDQFKASLMDTHEYYTAPLKEMPAD